MSDDEPGSVGPVLILDDIAGGRMHLAALFVAPHGYDPAPVETGDGKIDPGSMSGSK